VNQHQPLPLPPVPAPYQLPFHYGALHNVGIDYLVGPGPVREVLAERHPGLAAIGYQQYARGVDQSKLLGIARIHVLCDNPLAIDAGTRLYAEPKYPGWFEATMPSLNGPADQRTWSVTCKRAGFTADRGGIERQDHPLFSLRADLTGLVPESVNNTPITGYGTDPQQGLLAGPMNVYQPYQHHPLDGAAADRVALVVSDPASAVGRHLAQLVGDTRAAAVWTYQSPPVAAHNRPYYLPSK
jgi:hypothetical protein